MWPDRLSSDALRMALFGFAVGTTILFGQASNAYQDTLTAGRSLIQQANHAEALVVLQRAVAAEPGRHEAYFELAVTSYRAGNLVAAEEYANLALERAPDPDKAQVRDMLGVIVEKRKFETLKRDADEAFANGLMAKAADAYGKAFLLFPKQGAVGLRAATINAESLNRLLDAAVIWQKIIAMADDASAAIAREELGRRREELDRIAKERMDAAKQSQNSDELLQLTEAFPSNLEFRLELAAAYARKQDMGSAVKQLANANKLGLRADIVIGRREFVDLLAGGNRDPRFAKFIEDAFGSESLEKMRHHAERLAADKKSEEIKLEEARRLEEERRRPEYIERERKKALHTINTILGKIHGLTTAKYSINSFRVYREYTSVNGPAVLAYDSSKRTYKYTFTSIVRRRTPSDSYSDYDKTVTASIDGIVITDIIDVHRDGVFQKPDAYADGVIMFNPNAMLTIEFKSANWTYNEINKEEKLNGRGSETTKDERQLTENNLSLRYSGSGEDTNALRQALLNLKENDSRSPIVFR